MNQFTLEALESSDNLGVTQSDITIITWPKIHAVFQ